ncbi:primase-helicase family protein [Roseospirillum parvum]|uniref:NrS-1 polymerase-like helicase domain-containing protein n=1 Tax=Roseospirillum parvum TaxID=83401 RepID=A0A1G8E6W7_9PROT|nr:primase-helicase family protein [Roseospirillum parvum]SDH65698.1 hypothetical protein SAMN05421742_10956 [Roseospirillum parvum]
MSNAEMKTGPVGSGAGHTKTGWDDTRERDDSPSNGEKRKVISSLSDLPEVRNYLTRIGAEPRGLRSAVVKEGVGKYWRDIAVIKFDRDGTVNCNVAENMPTDLEQQLIKQEFQAADWPEVQPLHEIKNPPKMIKEADRKDVFEFRNAEGMIVMVQVRRETDDGGKAYIPWTYWDDGQWRMCEPEGPLPLYNADRLKGEAVVFIHEGAKAARNCQRLVDARTFQDKDELAAHPWGDQLKHSVHVGWIGGALSPYRTDWDVLKKAGIKRAYIVADNDEPGLLAVPKIAQHLRMPTFQIRFDDTFPVAFDLADPFPERMLRERKGCRVYVGPSFQDCLAPATWATDLIPNPRGKPSPVLRPEFAEQWGVVVTPPVFVNTHLNGRVLSKAEFDRAVRPFSHVKETSALIETRAERQFDAIDYRPDYEKNQSFNGEYGRTLNVFKPSPYYNRYNKNPKPPTEAQLRPWTDFLEHLIPDAGDRKEVERWCATLIARPEVRMTYSLLLVSEAQGVGKTTLAEKVLRPLVGEWNASIPSAEQVVDSSFNGWSANKRLVIVNELYAGNTSKAYNALKTVVDGEKITVNQKYMVPHVVNNWCHFAASSNSFRCLRLVEEDRRWLVPTVTEATKPQQYWRDLNEWLGGEGLQTIYDWALTCGNYVQKGQHAPTTEQKRRIIAESMTPGQQMVCDLAEAMVDKAKEQKNVVLLASDIEQWVRRKRDEPRIEGINTLLKTMRGVEGVWVCDYDSRPKVGSSKKSVVTNFDLTDSAWWAEKSLSWGRLKPFKQRPEDLVVDDM